MRTSAANSTATPTPIYRPTMLAFAGGATSVPLGEELIIDGCDPSLLGDGLPSDDEEAI